MKDGRTHLAHKAEHAVDLQTGALLALTVQGADLGDTTTVSETITAAAEQVAAVAQDQQANEQLSPLVRQAAATTSGVGQPATDAREAGQTTVTVAQRAGGTQFCSLI